MVEKKRLSPNLKWLCHLSSSVTPGLNSMKTYLSENKLILCLVRRVIRIRQPSIVASGTIMREFLKKSFRGRCHFGIDFNVKKVADEGIS